MLADTSLNSSTVYITAQGSTIDPLISATSHEMSLLQRGKTERKKGSWTSIILKKNLEHRLYFSCVFSLGREEKNLGKKHLHLWFCFAFVAGIGGVFPSL